MHPGQAIKTRALPRRFGVFLAAAIGLYAATHTVCVQAAQDFFLFPRANLIHVSDATAGSGLKHNDFDASLDFFYTAEFDKWRILGEFFISEDEHEAERLQIGWLTNANSTIWFGRYHNPQGYWNTQCHHGTYLQTSISRPGIHAFEDEGGIMATHLTGLALEGSYNNAENTWNYILALGAGPALENSLEPLGFFSSRGDSHKLSSTARFSYSPGINSSDEFGAFASRTLITGNGVPVAGVEQIASGFFSNWKWGKARLTGELFFVSSRVNFLAHSKRGSFTNAYLQPEYDWNPSWTFYTRFENTRGNKNDAYLALFPEFVKRRNLAGVRYNFALRQAFTVELSRSYRLNDEFNQITLQWSAGFP